MIASNAAAAAAAGDAAAAAAAHLDQVVQELHCILHVGLTVSTQPEHGVKHLTKKHNKALTSDLASSKRSSRSPVEVTSAQSPVQVYALQ
jgi:hypothetical protein